MTCNRFLTVIFVIEVCENKPKNNDNNSNRYMNKIEIKNNSDNQLLYHVVSTYLD